MLKDKKSTSIFLISLLVLLSMIIIRLCLGETVYSPIDILVGKIPSFILIDLRLPSVIGAIAIGTCLSFAGSLLNITTRNELADPGILGVSSGAIFFIVFSALVLKSSFSFISLIGVVGALITSLIIIKLSKVGNEINTNRMLLVGIGCNLLFSSLTTYLKSYLSSDLYNELTVLIKGNLDNVSMKDVGIFLPVIILIVIFVLKNSYNLSVLSLGKQTSTGLGLSYDKWKMIFIVMAVILTALSVMFGGAISFLGILGARTAKKLIKNNFKKQLLLGAIVSSILVILSDIISRYIFKFIIPLDITISLIGAPIFIYIFLKRGDTND